MTRVSIDLDPMPALRRAAEARIDTFFNAQAAQAAHVDAAHAQKRLWAATADPRLKSEADLRGVTIDKLAADILGRPDDVATREIRRVALKLKIRAAVTPQDIDAITMEMITA